jgi:hypothetical protein
VPEHGSGVILELAHVVWLDIARAITIKEQVEEGYKVPGFHPAQFCVSGHVHTVPRPDC